MVAKLLPTDEKYLFKMLGIRNGSRFIPGLSMIEFQLVVASSSLKVSEQKCEKSRLLICLCLILSIVEARIQNCEKWSLRLAEVL